MAKLLLPEDTQDLREDANIAFANISHMAFQIFAQSLSNMPKDVFLSSMDETATVRTIAKRSYDAVNEFMTVSQTAHEAFMEEVERD